MASLKCRVENTIAGIKRAIRKGAAEEVVSEEPCACERETINTSLYEILLTHPQFSWLLTDPTVRASINIREPREHYGLMAPHWAETLESRETKTVEIAVTQRTK